MNRPTLHLTVIVSILLLLHQTTASELITRPNFPSATAADHSVNPQFTGDGQVLLFSSLANNLVTNDNLDVYLDLFAYRLTDGNIALITINDAGTGGGNGDTYEGSISSNGQQVAFASAASNLVSSDINQAVDIFVRDLLSGDTRLITQAANGQGAIGPPNERGDRLSGSPQFSADGTHLVFESYATNLTGLPDANASTDIFLYDFITDQLTLVSLNFEGSAAAQGSSSQPSISADGHWVAFASTATNLTEQPLGTHSQVYVRNLLAGTNQLASGDVPAWFPEPRSTDPALSADGTTVVFEVTSIPSVLSLLMLYDVPTGQSTLITSNAHSSVQPIISADGRFVAYYTPHDVFRWDRLTGSNELVNVRWDAAGPGDQPAAWPAMTLDGRYLGFVSSATDLTSAPSNGRTHIFWRDMDTHETVLASVTAENVASSDDVDPVSPALHPGGTHVAFQSAAPDLVENDLNLATDLFLRKINPPVTQVISHPEAARPSESHGLGLPSLGWQPIDAQNNRIVFTASDREPSDTNTWADVYLRDRTRVVTVPLSVDSIDLDPIPNPSFQTQGPTYNAGISADGRYVIYMQMGQPTGWSFNPGNIVWIDIETGERRILDDEPERPSAVISGSSHTANIGQSGKLIAFYNNNGTFNSHVVVRDLDNPAADWKVKPVRIYSTTGLFLRFTPDDHWLLFINYSNSQRLVAWNLQSDELRELEPKVQGFEEDVLHPHITISADSRYVFATRSDRTMVRHDLLAAPGSVGEIVCTECRTPSVSADGGLVAYQSYSQKLFVKNFTTSETINFGTQGAYGPIVSRDGRFVSYLNRADLEFPEETHATPDLFVRDLLTQITYRLAPNLRASGASPQTSGSLVLAPDGRTVFFISLNPALVAHDYNNSADIFMVQLGAGDSDNDGMDDQWEITYFGNLERDGSGDFDQDGSTDLSEYLSGTSPIDDTSVLAVLIMTEANGASKTLFWPAIPGKIYQVEYKSALTDSGWAALSPLLTATSTTESYTDSSGGSQTYYRVRFVR